MLSKKPSKVLCHIVLSIYYKPSQQPVNLNKRLFHYIYFSIWYKYIPKLSFTIEMQASKKWNNLNYKTVLIEYKNSIFAATRLPSSAIACCHWQPFLPLIDTHHDKALLKSCIEFEKCWLVAVLLHHKALSLLFFLHFSL